MLSLSLKNPLRHNRHSNPNSSPKNLVKLRAHIPHTTREKLIRNHLSIDVNPCENFERRKLYWGFDFLLLRMQIVERDDDIYAPRVPNGSMSRAIHYSPLFCVDSFSRKSFSYNKLPQEPLRLTVLKLDGSSFEIQVAKKGTVKELKLAVEAAFSHLPKTGPGRVSWPHVWSQFCLSYNSHKLLNDSSYLGIYKIKDGDQLRFVRHSSINYNLARMQSEKEDSDLDDEPDRDRQENVQSHYIEILEKQQDDNVESDKGVFMHYEFNLTHLLRGWFPNHKLPSSEMTVEKSSSSSRFSQSLARSFKNVVRFLQ